MKKVRESSKMGNDVFQIQKIAAVVIFKELHTGKFDVYDVLSKFVNEIIIEKGLSSFTIEVMLNTLKSEFGFDSIPRSVVKTAINRLKNIKKAGNEYTVQQRANAENVHKLIDDLETKRSENDELISDLCNYISKKKNRELSAEDKEKITKAFCSYLFDEGSSEDEYSHDIAAYIIELKNESFKTRIENITQGIYQYSALTYNEDLSKIDRLKNELVLIFDTDILLSLGGFHGVIFKQYIEELLKLVSDINVKCGKKYIKVNYFDYSWSEVEDNFRAANYYLDGMNDYVREAARNIADGCKTKEDITLKQANFEAILRNKGITKLPLDSYSEENKEYNLEGDMKLFSTLDDQITMEEYSKAAKRASDVNKLRKGKVCKSFEDTRYIFITDNRKTGYIASKMSADKSTYFFVMDCCKITNVLWQKMNRGLSNQYIPASMNIITRSQVVLSGCISRKINHEFAEVKRKVREGELEEAALAAAIYKFRQVESKPEDITEENIDDRLDYIESSVKNYGEELSMYKHDSEQKEIAIKALEEKHQRYVSNVKHRDDLKNELSRKKTEKRRLDQMNKKITSKVRWKKNVVRAIELLISALIFLLIPSYFHENKIVGTIAALSPYYSAFWLIASTIVIAKPLNGFNDRIARKYEDKLKKKEGYSEEEHTTLGNAVVELQEKLDELENELKAG